MLAVMQFDTHWAMSFFPFPSSSYTQITRVTNIRYGILVCNIIISYTSKGFLFLARGGKRYGMEGKGWEGMGRKGMGGNLSIRAATKLGYFIFRACVCIVAGLNL